MQEDGKSFEQDKSTKWGGSDGRLPKAFEFDASNTLPAPYCLAVDGI